MATSNRRHGVAHPPPYLDFLLAGIATTTACLFTNPIEVVKTRMQLQGELTKSGGVRPYSNPFQAFVLITKTEGWSGIQSGLTPACCYQFVMNGARFGAYAMIKHVFDVQARPGEHNSPLVFVKQVCGAALSGMFGAVIASPFFLVKIRMQATVNAGRSATAAAAAAVGAQHHYRNTWHAFRSIISEEGLKGLARGANAAALRVAVGSAAQLPSYDQCKYLLYHTGWFSHRDSKWLQVCASLGSGVCVTTAMNPFDVVATRMYNQPVVDGKGAYYTSPLDCFIKIARAEGLRGFFKGYIAHYLRLGPHTVLGFVILEWLKKNTARFF